MSAKDHETESLFDEHSLDVGGGVAPITRYRGVRLWRTQAAIRQNAYDTAAAFAPIATLGAPANLPDATMAGPDHGNRAS